MRVIKLNILASCAIYIKIPLYNSVCSYSKLSQRMWERIQVIVRGKEMKDLSVLQIVVHCRNM